MTPAYTFQLATKRLKRKEDILSMLFVPLRGQNTNSYTFELFESLYPDSIATSFTSPQSYQIANMLKKSALSIVLFEAEPPPRSPPWYASPALIVPRRKSRLGEDSKTSTASISAGQASVLIHLWRINLPANRCAS